MATFTLDDIKAAAERKFGSTDIPLPEHGVLKLVNALQLPKDKRKALEAVQEKLTAKEAEDAEKGVDSEDEDAIEVLAGHLADAIRIVADSASGAEELLTLLDGNVAQLLALFNQYSGDTELGEA